MVSQQVSRYPVMVLRQTMSSPSRPARLQLLALILGCLMAWQMPWSVAEASTLPQTVRRGVTRLVRREANQLSRSLQRAITRATTSPPPQKTTLSTTPAPSRPRPTVASTATAGASGAPSPAPAPTLATAAPPAMAPTTSTPVPEVPAPSAPPTRSGAVLITSPFGWRVHPVTGVWKFHAGIDIASPRSTPIRSILPGVVAFSGPYQNYGNTVVVEHGPKHYTLYAHMDQTLVTPGQRVQQGDHLGLVGATGMATGPHLHFEVRLNGVFQDPIPYLRAVRLGQDPVLALSRPRSTPSGDLNADTSLISLVIKQQQSPSRPPTSPPPYTPAPATLPAADGALATQQAKQLTAPSRRPAKTTAAHQPLTPELPTAVQAVPPADAAVSDTEVEVQGPPTPGFVLPGADYASPLGHQSPSSAKPTRTVTRPQPTTKPAQPPKAVVTVTSKAAPRPATAAPPTARLQGPQKPDPTATVKPTHVKAIKLAGTSPAPQKATNQPATKKPVITASVTPTPPAMAKPANPILVQAKKVTPPLSKPSGGEKVAATIKPHKPPPQAVLKAGPSPQSQAPPSGVLTQAPPATTPKTPPANPLVLRGPKS